MIKLEINPNCNEESVVQWNSRWAMDNSSTASEFISNAGVEAQAAILAIISRMYEMITNHVVGKITKQQKKMIKETLIQIACQDVDVSMLDQFRTDMGREGGPVS